MVYSPSPTDRMSVLIEAMILDHGKRFDRIEKNVDLVRSALNINGKEIALLSVETHKQRRMLAALAKNQLTVEEHTGKIILAEKVRSNTWKFLLTALGILVSMAAIWGVIYECIKN